MNCHRTLATAIIRVEVLLHVLDVLYSSWPAEIHSVTVLF